MNRITTKYAWIFLFGLSMSLSPGLEVGAEETPTLKLMNLMRTELKVAKGIEIITSIVEIPPNSSLPKHHHPGEEFVYVLEGSGIVWQKDKADVKLKQGDIFKVPFKQVHTAKTGDQGIKALVFRVHKKGEPERILMKSD